jgi:hypothetical protein
MVITNENISKPGNAKINDEFHFDRLSTMLMKNDIED